MNQAHHETDTIRQITMGARLRSARHARNLTQQELAGTAFSKSYLSAVERNKMTPSIPALRLLAERLGVPLTYLLGEQEQPLQTRPSEQEALGQQFDEIEALLYAGKATAALERLGAQDADTALRQQNPAKWDWLRGWALLQTHQEQDAIALLERGRAEAAASEAPCALGHFTFTLATVQAAHQAEAAAEEGFQTALRCAEVSDDPDLLSHVEEHYAALLAARGCYRDAYLHQRAAVTAAARTHVNHHE